MQMRHTFPPATNPETTQEEPAMALVLLQDVSGIASAPTGLEWMVMASIIVPAVLLATLIYLGRKSAV